MIPVFRAADVERAVSPHEAYDAVRGAFEAHARGTWSMPSKVYVTNYPAGDFRAMPAIGDGHALLKWVTSFPGNPARGLPTVTGLVLLSDAEDGRLLAVLDAAAVTALRTAAAGVLAADALCRSEASSYAVVGAGVNGAETARMLVAHGVTPLVWDVDAGRRQLVADRLGVRVASSAEDALACEVVITVTPGADVLYPDGSLEAGQHVSLMGADGPGKAEVAVEELAARTSSATTGSRRATAASWRQPWRQVRHARRRHRARRGARRRRGRPPERRRHHAVRLDRPRDPGPRDREGRVPKADELDLQHARALAEHQAEAPAQLGNALELEVDGVLHAELLHLRRSGSHCPARIHELVEELLEPRRSDDLEDSAFLVAGVPERVPLSARLVDEVARTGLDDVVAEQRAHPALEHEAVLVLAVVAMERRSEMTRRHRMLDESEAALRVLSRNDEANADAAERSGLAVGWADDPGRGE